MENWIYTDGITVLKVVLTVLIIFIGVIIITRISGLRTFAKMSSFDFASTIAIGSIIATVIMNTDQSLLKGITALITIVGFQFLFSFAVRKSKAAQETFTNTPILLMEDGEILHDNLKATNIGENDLIAKLREANVTHFDQVFAVVLENTGDMSVLHGDSDKKLQEKVLQGVKPS